VRVDQAAQGGADRPGDGAVEAEEREDRAPGVEVPPRQPELEPKRVAMRVDPGEVRLPLVQGGLAERMATARRGEGGTEPDLCGFCAGLTVRNRA
jgi:hypothetical protein